LASLVEQAGGSQLFGNLTKLTRFPVFGFARRRRFAMATASASCSLSLALALRLADALTRVSQLGDKASFFQLGKGSGDLAEWEETHKEMLTGLLKADKARAVKKKKERVAELETPTQEAAE
jgi:hypothetical protein